MNDQSAKALALQPPAAPVIPEHEAAKVRPFAPPVKMNTAAKQIVKGTASNPPSETMGSDRKNAPANYGPTGKGAASKKSGADLATGPVTTGQDS
jgi:hypothetical protein